jgi:recombination protein RecT
VSNALSIIQDDIYGTRDQFQAAAIVPGMNFEREAGFAIQLLTANDYAIRIATENRQSVINAVTNIAAIGISLNPAKKQAYLVPRDGKICLDISYMGLLDIAIASGSIKWGQAELVYSADRFELNGFDKPPTHGRDPFSKERGELIGVYVVVKTADGDYLTTTMTIAEVFDIRDRSSAWKAWQNKQKKCPWVTDEGEMVKKTVIKRAYKLWPKTDRLDTAVHYLNTEGGEGLADIENAEPLDQPKNFGLTPARAKIIRAAAGAAIQKFNENDEWGAYEEVSWIDDNDEKEALWSILRPHSPLRSALKRMAAEERAKEEELTPANEQPPNPQ